jgi:hypothetical protein
VGQTLAGHDLDEAEEISEPGPMPLYLCDCALERARLALARLEAFAPLNGLVEPSPPPSALPDAAALLNQRTLPVSYIAMKIYLTLGCYSVGCCFVYPRLAQVVMAGLDPAIHENTVIFNLSD